MVQADATALSVSNLAAGYGAHEVLADVSFDVASGEMVGLIGLNGAGKTTLLKSILDLRFLDGGDVRIFGARHTDPRSRRALAFLPEQIAPSPVLKGREWLRMALAPYDVRWDRPAADSVCRRLALDPDALDRRVTTFSKGMGQKLGLVAMFLSERPLLVLDEPMSGLDPLARLRLKAFLLDYRDAGNAIFFSSHILADVAALCDRLAVLHEGRVAFFGTPDELRRVAEVSDLELAFLDAIDGGTPETAAV